MHSPHYFISLKSFATESFHFIIGKQIASGEGLGDTSDMLVPPKSVKGHRNRWLWDGLSKNGFKCLSPKTWLRNEPLTIADIHHRTTI